MEDWFIEMYTPCMAVFAKRTALGRGHQGSVWAFYGVVNGNCYGCKLLHSGLCQSFHDDGAGIPEGADTKKNRIHCMSHALSQQHEPEWFGMLLNPKARIRTPF